MSRVTHWQITIAQAALCFSFGIAAQTASQVTTSVTVAGNVAQTLSLTVADLKRYPAHQVEYVSLNSGEEKAAGSARRYTGCLLRDVLAAAKPVENKPRELRKSYVLASASDGYEVVFSWRSYLYRLSETAYSWCTSGTAHPSPMMKDALP
jgi:hypothetical protein